MLAEANKQVGRGERLETVPFLTGLTPYPLAHTIPRKVISSIISTLTRTSVRRGEYPTYEILTLKCVCVLSVILP